MEKGSGRLGTRMLKQMCTLNEHRYRTQIAPIHVDGLIRKTSLAFVSEMLEAERKQRRQERRKVEKEKLDLEL